MAKKSKAKRAKKDIVKANEILDETPKVAKGTTVLNSADTAYNRLLSNNGERYNG